MQNLNFVYTTELVTILLGILIFYFSVHNECVRGVRLKLIYVTSVSILAKVILEFVTVSVVNYNNYTRRWFMDTFCITYLCLQIILVCGILMYIHLLSGLRYDVKLANYFIIGLTILYIIGAVVLIVTNKMYRYENEHLVLGWLMPYAESYAMIANVLCYSVVMFHKKEYPKTIYRYIRLFMPIAFIAQLSQSLHQSVIYISIIYMIIITVLFFLYHNEVYNEHTGARNNDAFEAHMQKIFDHNQRFDLFILVLEIDFEKLLSDSKKEYSETLYQYSREIEYFGRHVNLYNVEKNVFAILSSDQDDFRRGQIRAIAHKKLDEAVEKCAEYASFKAYFYHEHEKIRSVEELKAFSGYLALTKGEGDVGVWNVAEYKDYDNFSTHNRLQKEILDIVRVRDLDDPRILCFAQPIYCVKDQQFHSAEALVRMQCEGEMVSPAEFIPIAEQLHCLHALTLIMLNKVCKFISTEGKDLDFAAITINSSPYELSSKSYSKDILDIIEKNQVDPAKIRIELTEASDITIDKSYKENMKNLYQAGIRFYLDDFGTGYSNLCRLFNMNIHTIKFDKSMLYESLLDDTIRDSLAAVARGFLAKGSQILVEGVETEEQERVALEMGFEYIQGFKYAKPVPINDLIHYFSKKS